MNDIYKSIEDYNPNKKQKISIGFDDMIANMLKDEKLNPVVTELFIRGRKIIISYILITQSCFAVKKYQTKFCPLIYYENSKQRRTLTNCI